jgi:hypothetical protein
MCQVHVAYEMRRHRHGKRTADRLSAHNLAALEEILRG